MMTPAIKHSAFAAAMALVGVFTQSCAIQDEPRIVQAEQRPQVEPGLLDFSLVRNARRCVRKELRFVTVAHEHGLHVVAQMSAQGEKDSVTLVRGSGNSAYDQAVLEAAERCQASVPSLSADQPFEVEIASGNFRPLGYQ